MTNTRRLAVEVLGRIEEGGYANLVLPPALAHSRLSPRDRAFVSELVYGTTRMRRACDWLVDAHLRRPVEPAVRSFLRLGAYQLAFLATPAHAAVSATVAEAPPRARGLVNAVLRRLADGLPASWPDLATELSYPDWVVERLEADLGPGLARAALVQMDEAPPVTTRADGYVQDQGSQWLADLVGARYGERVADLCAAPGGKATAMAAGGALVVAADVRRARAQMVAANVHRLEINAHRRDQDAGGPGGRSARRGRVLVVVADGRHPPLLAEAFDRVLVDAPCSGLGVLRRRPDARWRIQPEDVGRLAELQRQLLDAALGLLGPGGVLAYSVCTLTAAETLGIDQWLASRHPGLVAVPGPTAPWSPLGRGSLLLPQAAGTDGMYLLRLERPTHR